MENEHIYGKHKPHPSPLIDLEQLLNVRKYTILVKDNLVFPAKTWTTQGIKITFSKALRVQQIICLL